MEYAQLTPGQHVTVTPRGSRSVYHGKFIERLILNARSRSAAVSRFLCESCGESIPEARRIAVPGVELCVTCQEITELKSKHYTGAV